MQPPPRCLTVHPLDRLFPAKLFLKWLAYGNDGDHMGADAAYITCRELSVGFDTNITRYLSFKGGKQLRDYLVTRCPDRIDIGPVYNVCPSDRRQYIGMGDGFTCKERELIFDIDMDEYDSVRLCCSEGRICYKDWSYMAAAILVIDRCLREDFGYRHILWVYSGRRGVHCWVCDRRARILTDEERRAVVDFITVYKGQMKGTANLSVSNCAHPSVRRAHNICLEVWKSRILPEQRLLEDEQHFESIMKILDNPAVKEAAEEMTGDANEDRNQKIWSFIEKEASLRSHQLTIQKSCAALARQSEKVVLTYVYPRLDKDVSCKRNHLLKAPFCIHPKTGRVCVPIDLERIWEFTPEDVPTVQELNCQMEQHYKKHGEAANAETSLDPYLTHFIGFLEKMQTDNIDSLKGAL